MCEIVLDSKAGLVYLILTMANQTTIHPIRKQAMQEFLSGDQKLAWQLNQRATLAEAIEKACATTRPHTKARNKALAGVKWRLRGIHGEFVGLDSQVRCAFVPESEALVFDGQDNEERKIATYQAALGQLRLEVLPCAS